MIYEKDEDDDIGLQWKMAMEVFKTKPFARNDRPSVLTNPITRSPLHAQVDEGSKEFQGHEDVMKKLLGELQK